MKARLFAFPLAAALVWSAQISDEDVARVHRSAILIDTHNDVTSETMRGFDIGKPSSDTHTDIRRLRAGGVGAVFFAVWVSSSYVKGNQAAHRALEVFDTVRHDIVGKYPDDFQLATSAADIEAARKRGKIAALMGVEGGHAIEDSLRLLRQYYALGARYMTLTHSNTNNWCDSSGDAGRHNGLTAFGKEVVHEMNRLGMMVDISHVSDKAARDVLATSSAPVFASHSGCKSLSNIARNMPDDLIRAVAKKGGLLNINFGCEFLSQKSADTSTWTSTATRQQYEAELKRRGLDAAKNPQEARKVQQEFDSRMARATLEDVVSHIGHAVKLAGVDSVGIGSDFDGVSCTPRGLEDVSQFPNLTRALLGKGYSAEDIRKIYGGNMLRFMRSVESAASNRR
jgi:membrane dipeptidase